MEKRFYLCLVVFILMFGFVSAENKETRKVSSELINCKIEYNLQVIKLLEERGESISNTKLSSIALNLKNSSLTNEEYREIVGNQLEDAIKEARESSNFWKNKKYSKLSDSEKQELKSSFDTLRNKQEECTLSYLKTLGDKRIMEFEKTLSEYNLVIESLNKKGLDTTSMKKVVDDARKDIVDPLKSEITRADTKDEIQNILKKYCLFNGCRAGVNYHLNSKFELAKLKAIVEYKKSMNNIKQSEIGAVNTNVKSAEGIMLVSGDTFYNNGQESQIWGKIRSAYSALGVKDEK